MDGPLTSLIHRVDFLIDILEEENEHELHLDFLFILIPKHHALAELLLGLNLLRNVLNSHRLLIGGILVISLNQMSTFPQPHFYVNV